MVKETFQTQGPRRITVDFSSSNNDLVMIEISGAIQFTRAVDLLCARRTRIQDPIKNRIAV